MSTYQQIRPLHLFCITSSNVKPQHRAWEPSVLESKSNKLISHMHYSCCLNPIDPLLSQNCISNPIPFVIQCPSPQHHASFYLCCMSHKCGMNTTDNVALVIFHTPVCSHSTEGCSFDTAPVNLMRDPTPLPQTATKDDYQGNILFIVRRGQLLIKF